MGWGDDLLKGIKQNATNVAQSAAGNVVQSAQQFFERNVSSGLVSVGAKPLGNLSAKEIENGETGATPSVQAVIQSTALSMPILIGIAIGAYFLLKGRRG